MTTTPTGGAGSPDWETLKEGKKKPAKTHSKYEELIKAQFQEAAAAQESVKAEPHKIEPLSEEGTEEGTKPRSAGKDMYEIMGEVDETEAAKVRQEKEDREKESKRSKGKRLLKFDPSKQQQQKVPKEEVRKRASERENVRPGRPISKKTETTAKATKPGAKLNLGKYKVNLPPKGKKPEEK